MNRKEADAIIAEMIAAGFAQAATKDRFPVTGPNGHAVALDGQPVWRGWSLYGDDACHNALAAPDCPEGAKVFLRRLVGAPEDPDAPYWKDETLATYLRRYTTHPEYVLPGERA